MALETTEARPLDFDRKRLRILAAAARVFCTYGYDKASMRRIAAEAGVSLAGIYYYVASKEELLAAIQLHTFDSLLRGLRAGLAGVTDPRDRLAAAVRNHVRHFGEEIPELMICARELETLWGTAPDEVRRLRRAYFEAVHELVQGIGPRPVAPVRSSLATANLFGMLNWVHQWHETAGTRVELDELAARQTALFLDGYVASGSGDDGGGER
jgi:AcrR family transcriptional regulator